MHKFLSFLFVWFVISPAFAQSDKSSYEWTELEPLPNEIGLNGAFMGVHNNALLFAGGANFPNNPASQGGKKVWHDQIYVYQESNKEGTWLTKDFISLPKALANGVSISTNQGVLCIGGDNEQGIYSDVFLLQWNETTSSVDIEQLPPIPFPLSGMGASVVDDVVYLVGGQTTKGGPSTQTFLSFNLKPQLGRPLYTWAQLEDFPGESRIQPVVIGQSNGYQNCLYVFSGLHYDGTKANPYKMLGDVHQYDPHKNAWTKKNSIPNNGTPGFEHGYIAAAPAIKNGDSHILIFGGAGGPAQHLNNRMTIWPKIKSLENRSKYEHIPQVKLDSLRQKDQSYFKSTSFSNQVLAYHTITDTWTVQDTLPFASQVVTNALPWNDGYIFPCGEIRPGVRTNQIHLAKPIKQKPNFGLANYLTLFGYLILVMFIGLYFSKRNKTTQDYFLGGKRIPWWAAGLSIYATMLSAITYLSQPALSYSFDWQTYLGYFTILLMAPIVIHFYLPFYQKLNLVTAYEYLEKRFNLIIRMYGSLSFVLFQLVRMGIVVYLPALALSTVIGLDIYMAIIIMGILAIAYTYVGGIEAVIWTDVIQVCVLLLGLIAGLIYIAVDIGDVGHIFKTAYNDSKLTLVDLRFSYTEVVTWSLFIGSFALNLAPYTTDQTVVQRYMTTVDEKAARKSIWLNGLISIPSGILIFMMGTFLYVYFKEHPEFLVIGMQNDGIFPLFIANHLPPGIAGLVIAGIFSASMSSLDSSMHSVSTVVTIDFYKRFTSSYNDHNGLKLAKYVTAAVGILGTTIACLMAAFPVKSLFFLFQEVVGLIGSSLAGVFILGIFVKRANWRGTLIGIIISVLALAFVKYNTPLNFYIYPLIGIPVCVLFGYIFSLILPSPRKNIEGLYYRRSN